MDSDAKTVLRSFRIAVLCFLWCSSSSALGQQSKTSKKGEKAGAASAKPADKDNGNSSREAEAKSTKFWDESNRFFETLRVQSSNTGDEREASPTPEEPLCFEEGTSPESVPRGVYPVTFDVRNQRFYFPRRRQPVEQEQIVLCILDKEDAARRYRLVFNGRVQGASSVANGDTIIGFAPDGTSSTALRAEATIAERKAKCSADEDERECQALNEQIHYLLQVALILAADRDRLARFLVESDQLPPSGCVGQTKSDELSGVTAIAEVPNSLCIPDDNDAPEDAGRWRGLVDYPTLSEDRCHFQPAKRCKNPTTWEFFVNHLLRKTGVTWADGQWHFTDIADVKSAVAKPQPPTPGRDERREERAQVLKLLEKIIHGYDDLLALATRITDEALHRKRVFYLGRFEGNTIVSASLEEYESLLDFGEHGDALVYHTRAVVHPLSLVVAATSWYQMEVGFVKSFLRDPDFALEPNPGLGTNRVLETGGDGFFGLGLFASVLWCAQDVSKPIYDRQCADGWDWRRLMPSVALGIPVSSDLAKGRVFVGMSLPYIPYLSIVTGVEVGNVHVLKTGISTGDTVAATDVSQLQHSEIHAGFFVAANLKADLFYTFFPKLKPAE